MVTTNLSPVRRLHARMEANRTNGDQGSLILDILIGMAIFALIALIAVSAIGQYRARTYEQGAVSDVKTLATALEAARIDDAAATYPALGPVDAAAYDTTLTKKNSAEMVRLYADGENFRLCVEHDTGTGAYAVYDSLLGGVVESERTGGCPAPSDPTDENPPGVDDIDGDGLTDAEEIALGTDPNDPDSDADGVNDWQEVRDGTDPLVATPLTPVDNSDRDGDGLLNDEETEYGFDPDDAHSWITRIVTSDHLGVSDYQARHNIDTDGDGASDVDEVLRTNNAGPAGKSDWRKADTDDDNINDPQEIDGGSKPNDAYSWIAARGLNDALGLKDGAALSGDDHDHDGIPSHIEVSTSKVNGGTYKGNLDWNSPDTDGDGWNDGDESSNGFDPTDRYSWISKAGISDAMGVTDGDLNNGIDSDRDGEPDFMEVMNGTFTP